MITVYIEKEIGENVCLRSSGIYRRYV